MQGCDAYRANRVPCFSRTDGDAPNRATTLASVSPIWTASNALFRLLEISEQPPIYATRMAIIATTAMMTKDFLPLAEDVEMFSLIAWVARSRMMVAV
jgi:hypothetical protein